MPATSAGPALRHAKCQTLPKLTDPRYGPPLVWTRNNAAGIWDCRVELPHCLVGSPLAAAAVAGPVAGLPAPASGGKAGGGSASKRPPLHPNSTPGGGARAAAGVGGAAGAISGGTGGIPRQRSVQAIPQHEDVEKQQPGVTAQPDDARLLSSPVFDASAAAAGGVAAAAVAAVAAEGDAANLWRSLLEEELRWVAEQEAELGSVRWRRSCRTRRLHQQLYSSSNARGQL